MSNYIKRYPIFDALVRIIRADPNKFSVMSLQEIRGIPEVQAVMGLMLKEDRDKLPGVVQIMAKKEATRRIAEKKGDV